METAAAHQAEVGFNRDLFAGISVSVRRNRICPLLTGSARSCIAGAIRIVYLSDLQKVDLTSMSCLSGHVLTQH